MTWARTSLLLAWIALLALSGCGSALRTHAIAAHTTQVVIDETCGVIESERNTAAERANAQHEYREDARAAVAEARAAWQPAIDTCNLLVEAHGGWVDALALAASGGDPTLTFALTYVERIPRLYGDLQSLLAGAFHITLPPLPPELLALVTEPR